MNLVEQVGEVTEQVHEKDLGYDPECGPMISVRVYHTVTVAVHESLLPEGVIEPTHLWVSEHCQAVRKDSDLHRELAELYPNHRGWGYFGVVSLDSDKGNLLTIEFRGY